MLRGILGLASDFWKNGDPGNPGRGPAAFADDLRNAGAGARPFVETKTVLDFQPLVIDADGLWHARPGEISERMWGVGCTAPAGDNLNEKLVQPLALAKDMALLDLSAGLGDRVRRLALQFDLHASGLDPDAAVAARGMELSEALNLGRHAGIAPYDPAQFAAGSAYDAVVFRETTYRVLDKEKFVKAVAAACRPHARLSFTDYIVNPEMRNQGAIIAWREMEPGANPVSLVEMAELWARAGVNLSVHDDQTDYYKKEVLAGLGRFAKFMAAGIKPDAVTRKAIDKRITTWAHRMAAIDAGMKFYRFHGTR